MRATTLIPFLAVLAAAAPAAAAVDLTGQSLSASFSALGGLSLTNVTPFVSPATVGPGVEFTGQGTDVPGRRFTFTLDVNSTGFDLGITNIAAYDYLYTGLTSKIFGIHLAGLSGIGAISLDDYSCAGQACAGGGAGPRVVTATSDASTADVTFSALRAGETYSFKFANPAGPPPGVPEPATWALMIGGFGLAGAALRRRRALFA